ncbi:hypothetical protein CTAYLR_001186 [Chrysophaeum taylorii]|uniref:NADH:ubiquinone oxidoreductase intermediate-associated protein 30 domain-containing protein n=1 Tax=Chrysophaeum taylorii TaxID=2483200 RepID=A0AAD7XS38_9STRA|nr:hypothetical protein CTAYLR_001186 [Chrysophaeum taylorii]
MAAVSTTPAVAFATTAVPTRWLASYEITSEPLPGTTSSPPWLSAGAEMVTTEASLVQFRGPDALNLFERIDDVVMGGVSSSSVRQAEGRAVWSGIVRVEGGGFCGARTKPFVDPLDLSGFDGLYVDAKTSDDKPRSWKLTLRCSRDRGEVVYNAEVDLKSSSSSRSKVLVPFSAFRLVRGPRPLAGAPPLTKVDLEKVFGFGLTCSKFGPSGDVLEDFQPGFFAVDLYGIGVFGEQGAVAPTPPVADAAVRSNPNSANRAGLFKLLKPLSRFVFSEEARRRKRVRELLVQRGSATTMFGARFKGQRIVKRGYRGLSFERADLEGLSQLFKDGLRALLAPALRFLFRTIFLATRQANILKKKTSALLALLSRPLPKRPSPTKRQQLIR